MFKPKRKINRNQIIGMIMFIPAVLLLIAFFFLALSRITLTDNTYSTLVFSFVFGLLGLVTSIGLFFTRT